MGHKSLYSKDNLCLLNCSLKFRQKNILGSYSPCGYRLWKNKSCKSISLKSLPSARPHATVLAILEAKYFAHSKPFDSEQNLLARDEHLVNTVLFV